MHNAAMEARQESRLPAHPFAPASPSSLPEPAAETIERVLARTEAAIEAIEARTERQVRQVATDLELRTMEEAVERRMRLERVRHELADRATALLSAYEGIYQRLGEIDTVLAGWTDQAANRGQAWPVPAQAPPGKVALRERRRIPWRREAA